MFIDLFTVLAFLLLAEGGLPARTFERRFRAATGFETAKPVAFA